MSSEESYKIFTDLDALLDTRLATLATIDVDIANELGKSKKYRLRHSDNFSLLDKRIDDKIYRDRFLKRDVKTLDFALSTDVIVLISLGLRDMLETIHRGITPKNTRLVVNTYPYKLSEERLKYIEGSILHLIPYEIKLDMVHIDYFRMTPRYMSSNYDEWYIYDIEPWIAQYQEELLARPITKLQIVLPKLSTGGNDPSAESFDIEPFKARELLFSPYMSLNYVDLASFSYNHEFTNYVKEKGFFD